MKKLYIHQIYGLFEDDIPFTNNKLFEESYLKYTFICHNNNKDKNKKYEYEYKLWNKESCEELLKKYTQFNYYYDVRFKVMKVDIMRFLILYEYGGIYSDMDIIPQIYNFDFVMDSDKENIFLCIYINTRYKNYDIEIIATPFKNNKFLYEYLSYIPAQIEEKNNIEIYKSWKVRYIFQTTGPRSLIRFIDINKYDNKIISMNTYFINENEKLDKNNLLKYDEIIFYSYFSLSYGDISGKRKHIYINKKKKKS